MAIFFASADIACSAYCLAGLWRLAEQNRPCSTTATRSVPAPVTPWLAAPKLPSFDECCTPRCVVKEEKTTELSPGSTCADDPMASMSSLASRQAEASSLECSPSVASAEAEDPALRSGSPSVVSTAPSFDDFDTDGLANEGHGAGVHDGPCNMENSKEKSHPQQQPQQPQQQTPEPSRDDTPRLSVDALLEQARERLLEDSAAQTGDEGGRFREEEAAVAGDGGEGERERERGGAAEEEPPRHDAHLEPDATILGTLVGKWQITTPRATTVCTVRGDGSTLFNGRHMGDEYDIVEEVVAGEVVVRRCDGWFLDLPASKKGLLVWRKEGQPDISWVRVHAGGGSKASRDGHHNVPSDGSTVTVSILLPRRSAQLQVKPVGLFSCGSCRCATAEELVAAR